MSAVLIRQSDSSRLVLDGATLAREDSPLAVQAHPYESRRAVVDHVQRLARRVEIDVTVTQSPTIEGLTRGPERLAEVAAWLDAAVAEPLTLVIPTLPALPDMLLSALPREVRPELAWRARLSFVEARFATVRQVGLAPAPAPTRQGFAATADKGQTSGEEVRNQSTLAALRDLAKSTLRRSP